MVEVEIVDERNGEILDIRLFNKYKSDDANCTEACEFVARFNTSENSSIHESASVVDDGEF